MPQRQIRDRRVLARLFVYGTLQPGFAAHSFLSDEVVSSSRAAVSGWLFAHPAGYPALVLPGPAATGILGAPQRVPGTLLVLAEHEGLWKRLDHYEDCDRDQGLYIRERRQVETLTSPEAEPTEAWLYHWNPRRLSELIEVAERVSGWPPSSAGA